LKESAAPAELYARPHWFACLTRARAEKVVARMMTLTGLETYLPLIESERKWADRTKRLELPLFPSYVFARFTLTQIHTVLSTPGLATVLRPNGYPTPVRDEEIQSVRCMVRGMRDTGEEAVPEDFLTPGSEVVVESGPFMGMSGVLIRRRGKTRVAVRITALQQAISVVVREGVLKVVGAPEGLANRP
jgi:transcription antitermination factor NusG